MSNLEFAAELTKRSIKVLGDESKAQAALDEFELLDPREAQIIYRAFSNEPDSVEYVHTKARITALVASGKVSKELAALATMDDSAPTAGESDNEDLDYQYSRMAAYAELGLPHNELLDPTGKISHMIERGDSKGAIFAELGKSTLYKAREELIANPPAEDDFQAQLAVFQFNELHDALDGMLDPKVAPDTKAIAKEAVADYDEDGSIARLIDAGGTSKDVFNALDFSPLWLDKSQDYMTRDEVEMPRYSQTASWNAFRAAVNAIKDLDSL